MPHTRNTAAYRINDMIPYLQPAIARTDKMHLAPVLVFLPKTHMPFSGKFKIDTVKSLYPRHLEPGSVTALPISDFKQAF